MGRKEKSVFLPVFCGDYRPTDTIYSTDGAG